MGWRLAALWMTSFLAMRGMLLFDTHFDWIILASGTAALLGLPDGDLEVLDKYWQFHKRNKELAEITA
jgi:hypothetical protein